jgi:hypothetical protein
LSASAHCASVPKWLRNSGIDMPCWNWIWWLDIRALHQQENSGYGLSSSLDKPADAGSKQFWLCLSENNPTVSQFDQETMSDGYVRRAAA